MKINIGKKISISCMTLSFNGLIHRYNICKTVLLKSRSESSLKLSIPYHVPATAPSSSIVSSTRTVKVVGTIETPSRTVEAPSRTAEVSPSERAIVRAVSPTAERGSETRRSLVTATRSVQFVSKQRLKITFIIATLGKFDLQPWAAIITVENNSFYLWIINKSKQF